MEQWKAAFKQIFGKTPTKADCSTAPSSLRPGLPISPEKPTTSGHGRKRKRLVLKRNEAKDEEFCSPIKKRPTKSKMVSTIPQNDDQANLQLLRPPSIDPFLSPLKNWKEFMTASPSPDAQKRRQRLLAGSPSALLKTPSPAKWLRRPIAHTNIGNLLTPVKQPKSSLEEEEEEDEYENNEKKDKMEEGEGIEEKGEEEDDEDGPKKKQVVEEANPKKRRAPQKAKAAKANYVSLNLRRRQFAPISKFGGKNGNGKKNWKKWKREGGGGGRRGLFLG